jgi:hypothetical protein
MQEEEATLHHSLISLIPTATGIAGTVLVHKIAGNKSIEDMDNTVKVQ